jgi:hypothetical protein
VQTSGSFTAATIKQGKIWQNDGCEAIDPKHGESRSIGRIFRIVENALTGRTPCPTVALAAGRALL